MKRQRQKNFKPKAPARGTEGDEAKQPSEDDAKLTAINKLLREVWASGNPERGLPADKDFIDSLYEDD